MATKKEELAEAGKQQAGLVINNAFIDGMVAQLKEKEKFGLTFPKDYNPSNELMGAYLILKETVDRDKKPVLQSCSQTSIANALMDMVNNGLSIMKKQAYFVAFGGKLSCMPSVYGNTCNARRYGMKNISAMVIYDGDVFKYHIEDGEIVIDKHEQDFMNIDTDKIVGAYAIAKMEDGTKHVEVMNISMIKQAWKQGFSYKEGAGTHAKFTDQMAMKTVKNRCLKYIIRTFGTPDEENFLNKSEEIEQTDVVAENVAYEIENNANMVDFEPEVVESAEVVDASDVPDFMKTE